MVVKTGNLLITSGHVSDIKGKLGAASRVEIATTAIALGLNEAPHASR